MDENVGVSRSAKFDSNPRQTTIMPVIRISRNKVEFKTTRKTSLTKKRKSWEFIRSCEGVACQLNSLWLTCLPLFYDADDDVTPKDAFKCQPIRGRILPSPLAHNLKFFIRNCSPPPFWRDSLSLRWAVIIVDFSLINADTRIVQDRHYILLLLLEILHYTEWLACN